MKKDVSQALSIVFIQKKTLAAYRDILIPRISEAQIRKALPGCLAYRLLLLFASGLAGSVIVGTGYGKLNKFLGSRRCVLK